MQRCRAPEHEVREPARVVDELVVVRAREERVVVRAVRGEEADGAGDEQVERRAFRTCLDREANQRTEQQHVAERIRDRDELGEDRQPGQVEVRRDEEHPREQCEADREDQRVDDRRAVAAVGITAADEQHQAGEQRRIHGEVDGVPGGGEPDLPAEEIRIGVGVEVAGDVQPLAEQDQQPGEQCPRAMQPDARGDRDERRDPDHVDDDGVALERRHEEIRGRQKGQRDDVPGPERLAPGREPAHERHAACSVTDCRSNASATLPSTSISRSTSASELAAVS